MTEAKEELIVTLPVFHLCWVIKRMFDMEPETAGFAIQLDRPWDLEQIVALGKAQGFPPPNRKERELALAVLLDAG